MYLPEDSLIKLKVNDSENNKNLKLFEIFKEIDNQENYNFILNVGNPIWSIDWCNVPFHGYFFNILCIIILLKKKKEHQYIAISVQSKKNNYHPINQKFTGKNLIQIWNMGLLYNETETK